MGSLDLRRLLAGWEYEPSQITVRKIVGDDGSVKIQMRLDLGLLQMEPTGRPDGKRPCGFTSLLEHQESLRDEYLKKNGTALGFEIPPDVCQELREEAVQYYHRYLAEFVLEDFEGVARDTARNLRVLDLCRDHAREESDRVAVEQYRGYLVMMNTRAQAHVALRRGAFKTALARVKAGLNMIREVMADQGQAEAFDKATEVLILKALHDEIAARLPADPIERLEMELEKALAEERYEDACILRDRMAAVRVQQSAAPRKKQKD